MKHAVAFTRRQKSIVAKSGKNPNEWLLLQETRDGLTIIHKEKEIMDFIPTGVGR